MKRSRQITENNVAGEALKQCETAMVLILRCAPATICFAFILILTGCDTTAAINDLMQLGSQAGQDKLLLEALVKDLKATPQTAASKAVEPNQLTEVGSSNARLQALQTLYNDTVAAQVSLLTVLSFGAGQAKRSELDSAATGYEMAAAAFLQGAAGEVARRYSSAKGISSNAAMSKSLPAIEVNRSRLSRAFATRAPLRMGIINNLKTTMVLTPWSDL